MSSNNNPSSIPTSSPTHDFRYIGDNFFFQGIARTWSGCLAYGHYHGYELASIGGLDEAQVAVDFMNYHNKIHNTTLQEIWTGGHQPRFVDFWVWSDGTDFDVNLFAPLEPDDEGSCIVLTDLKELEDDDCSFKRHCLYETKVTSEPSNSRVPTNAPTKSFSPTITPQPSNSNVPSNTPSQTNMPTTTISPTSGWNIGSASVVFKVNVNPQMVITHSIGSRAASIRVKLLDQNCNLPLDSNDNTYLIDSSTILTNGIISGPTAKYAVEFADLELSNVMQDNTVHFCTKLELLDENRFSASFRYQKFLFDVDMSVGFSSIIVNTEESAIDEISFEGIEFYGVTACQCQIGFRCSSATVDQNTDVSICITTSSPVVRYTNFDLVVTGDGFTTFQYKPVIVGGNGSEGQFGTTIQEQDQIIKINFPLVTGLFDDNSDSIFVNGSGLLQIVSDATKANENGLTEIVSDAPEVSFSVSASRSFDMKVTVVPAKRSGCLGILFNKAMDLFLS